MSTLITIFQLLLLSPLVIVGVYGIVSMNKDYREYVEDNKNLGTNKS